MAILRGFPPSNSIQLDGPSKFTCELCGKDFWQSFPLGLRLDLSGDVNFDILPCRECYEMDQGRRYWSNDPNKWGDGFNIYSKVREKYTPWEIAWQRRGPPYKKREKVRWDFEKAPGDTINEKFEDLYKKIEFEITSFWSVWRTTGIEAKPPSTLVARTNKMMCEMFDTSTLFERTPNGPYYGVFKNAKWEWRLLHDPIIPEYPFKAIFMEEV